MADFKNVMKDWRRMCKKFDESMNCDRCPLSVNQVCGCLEESTDKDIENAEKIITEWAEKNPEKVYPTWLEWLSEQFSIMGVERSMFYNLFYYEITVAGGRINEPIPADIAERLGLEPKVKNNV